MTFLQGVESATITTTPWFFVSMTAQDSVANLDAILKDNKNLLERFRALGPRAVWVDKENNRWSLPAYVSCCALQPFFSPNAQDWLKAAIEWRTTQPIPTSSLALQTYRQDLVWLWAAAALAPFTSLKMDQESGLLALKKAMEDPTTGPGPAGWGVRGEGWLAEALLLPRKARERGRTHDQHYRDTHTPHLPSTSRLLTCLMHANTHFPHAFLFQPAVPLATPSELPAMAFSPRASRRSGFASFAFPTDTLEHLGALSESVIAISLDGGYSPVPGNTEDLKAFWKNIPRENSARLVSTIFYHLAEEMSSNGAGSTAEPLEIKSPQDGWLGLAATALSHHPEALAHPNVQYVMRLLVEGKVTMKQNNAVLSHALMVFQNMGRAETLDAALPAAFGASLRHSPRF